MRKVDDPAILARFWKKVAVVHDETSCWLWTGATQNGYGVLNIEKQLIRSNRFVYSLIFGDIPAGMFVCHRCDVRGCCRPSHLFLGTNTDNMRDAVQKGRTRQGEKHPLSALTTAQVIEIRRLCAAHVQSMRSIAKIYGVRHQAISKIVHKKRWKHVL
ncbi:HNH endonuclease [soil metagenome]